VTPDFFERPILNSPYEYPSQHWELDAEGQPTNNILKARRKSAFVTPVPKPRKRRRGKNKGQRELVFKEEETATITTAAQQYDTNTIINEIRQYVDQWRALPNPQQWQVTPETARLLQHWRKHPFENARPFFCQVEAIETAIWLTEVASHQGDRGKKFLDYLSASNAQANLELLRIALKLATGAGKTTVIAMLIAWQTINAVRHPQQAHKADKINFTSLTPWPGKYICAEGRYLEGEGENAPQKRAGIFIGPEFGTVSRPDLVAAAREAADAGFDVLIACAFNYDAHSAEFEKLGKIPVLKARMNPDLHMAGELKTTASANLFVIFGEPDIEIENAGDSKVQVRVKGVDVFKPQTGEVVSDGPDGIACWFIDTNYNEESFFVRHAYFLGANDPYKSLKTTLRAEIDEAAWESLHSDTSRPFPKPETGRIAVKVINHLGDEVMKVFAVS
jgi:hypothetical protein